MACADDAAPATMTPAQAQARQFGMFIGGTASQYDLCARKGFLAVANPSAENTARTILEKMKVSTSGVDQSVYAQQGWDMIKSEISEDESFYTRERCAAVGREWAKIIASVNN